jgi:hypothetical protein
MNKYLGLDKIRHFIQCIQDNGGLFGSLRILYRFVVNNNFQFLSLYYFFYFSLCSIKFNEIKVMLEYSYEIMIFLFQNR